MEHLSKAKIKESYEFVTTYRISVQEDLHGKGHTIVFHHLEEASIHISKWIGKCIRIDLTVDKEFKKDMDYKTVKQLIIDLENEN